MLKILALILNVCLVNFLFAQNPHNMNDPHRTHFEKDNNYTPTYREIIETFTSFDRSFDYLKMNAVGSTDSGFPLHEIILSKHGFDPVEIKQKNIPVFMINNGIHPGEPCGIDASMLFVRNILTKQEWDFVLDNMVVVVIPVYNIGGALMRSSNGRANQIGPKEYGFRGNAKNYDLNRDFIKSDAANTKSFYKIFNTWQPDIFVDTHTSNGADYTYTMTLIASQNDKLGPIGKKFQEEEILPALYKKMEEKNWGMIPYVYSKSGETPDHGIKTFLDTPRYSSGFTSLHHCWTFMPEAHMLKPYADRVYSTLAFLESMSSFIVENAQKILLTRKLWKKNTREQITFHLDYILDESKVDSLEFKGYQAKHKESDITGHKRLYYDREKPYVKNIPYYSHYNPSLSVEKPKAYILPQAYKEIVEKLESNNVVVEKLSEDKTFKVEKYRIKSYKTVKEPYEGHYLHSSVQVESFTTNQSFSKGDFYITTDQEAVRFIIETLEPHAPDSYFAWNFFDGILMQKEYYSAYVFEDLAVDILEKNQELKIEFLNKKKEDEAFAKDARAQLDYIYQRSPFFEPNFKVYPVARVLE